MNKDAWKAKIVFAVSHSANGHPQYLETLGQKLADVDTARESLIAHGFGNEEDDIAELVATVLEGLVLDE